MFNAIASSSVLFTTHVKKSLYVKTKRKRKEKGGRGRKKRGHISGFLTQ
jgi:hypothetical protein